MKGKVMVLTLVLLSTVVAQAIITETFSDYLVEITINPDGSAHVSNYITIKNVINRALVPGEGYIKLSKIQEDMFWIFPTGSSTQKFQSLSNLEIHDTAGNVLNGKADFFPKETIITYAIWTPIEAGQTYSFVVEYDTPDLTAPGVLFTSGATPQITSSVPVEKSTLKVILPKGVYISYAPGSEIEKDDGTTLISADIGGLNFEYTGLPFATMPIKGSTVFWLIIITIIIVLFFATKYFITQFDMDTTTSVDKKKIIVDLNVLNKRKEGFRGEAIVELFDPEKICVYTGRKPIKILNKAAVGFSIKRDEKWVPGSYIAKVFLVDEKEKRRASKTTHFELT